MEETYIYHSGILGMKWGIRRYQNPDGSLTEEGRLRYGYNTKTGKYKKLNKAQRKIVKAQIDLEKEMNKPLRQRKIKYMSDDEIREYTNRITAENAAERLRSENNKFNAPEKTKVQQFTDKLVNQVIVPAAINAGRSYVEQELKNLLKVNNSNNNNKDKK